MKLDASAPEAHTQAGTVTATPAQHLIMLAFAKQTAAAAQSVNHDLRVRQQAEPSQQAVHELPGWVQYVASAEQPPFGAPAVHSNAADGAQ